VEVAMGSGPVSSVSASTDGNLPAGTGFPNPE